MGILGDKNQTRTIILGTLIVSLVPSTYVFLQRWILGTQNQDFYCTVVDYFQSSVFSVVVTFSLFILNIKLIHVITNKFEHRISEVKRILLCLTAGLISSNIVMFLEWKLFNTLWFKVEAPLENVRIFENQMMATILVIIVSLVLEIRHYMERLKISIAEKEHLEREYLRAQLEGLKTQISPHFLFNSFNALQSLIEDQPTKAKEFIQELAKVYRYVLDKRDNMVVTLEEEIVFMNSFIYLKQIRFGDSLQVEIDIASDELQNYLPPLTLQLLIENSIKHNIIAHAKPLKIVVTAHNNQLVVSNNYQPRLENTYSTKIGHQNLTDRYKLISDKAPTYGIEGNQYVARIPLIDKTSTI